MQARFNQKYQWIADKIENEKEISIAKNMLLNNEQFDKIKKYTGLSKEEINRIKI
jgi:hypothetical protein